jgi:hypothetical protein
MGSVDLRIKITPYEDLRPQYVIYIHALLAIDAECPRFCLKHLDINAIEVIAFQYLQGSLYLQ